MDKFVKQEMMIKPDGTKLTLQEYSNKYFGGGDLDMFKNNTYQVMVKKLKSTEGTPGMVWLSIKRIDKEPIHDWRELQEIKNALVGPECEGIELYPAESRRVDTSNQYHLWCWTDKEFRIGLGFEERLVTDEDVAASLGAKQRPFKK